MFDLHRLMRLISARGPMSLAAAAEAMGETREGVARTVGRGIEMGVPLSLGEHHVELTAAIDLLDPPQVRRAITDIVPSQPFGLEVHAELDSTNAYLMRRLATSEAGAPPFAAETLNAPLVCITEFQSAGRGRRGRTWLAPFGAGVLGSVAWPLAREARLEGLSLAVGVGVVDGLRALGVTEVGLKWPNDVVAGAQKAAGILVETRQVPAIGWVVVAGAGLNVRPVGTPDGAISQPWTTVDAMLGHRSDRDAVAGSVFGKVLSALATFSAGGFLALRRRWEALDVTAGRAIRLHTNEGDLRGVGCGVDDDGALRAEIEGEVRTFHSAEVSLRLDEDSA